LVVNFCSPGNNVLDLLSNDEVAWSNWTTKSVCNDHSRRCLVTRHDGRWVAAGEGTGYYDSAAGNRCPVKARIIAERRRVTHCASDAMDGSFRSCWRQTTSRVQLRRRARVGYTAAYRRCIALD